MKKLVRVERSRGRVSLGAAVPGLQPGDLFEVEVDPDGRIIMIPLATVRKKDQ